MNNGNTTEKDIKLALHFLTFGVNYYLQLVSNVFEKTVDDGNIWVVSRINEKVTTNVLDKETKWSDFKIIIPTLFCFYHGIELIMKGLLAIHDRKYLEAKHDLTDFLLNIDNIEDIPGDIKNLLHKYVDNKNLDGPQFIFSFLRTNGLTIDGYYNILRYPTDINFDKYYDYFGLKYQGEKAIPELKSMLLDIKKMGEICIEYYNKFDEL
jgi:hypothetical protein